MHPIRHAPGEGERITGPWDRSMVLKAGPVETRSLYSILEFTSAPGSPWSTHHIHETTEAWYVLDGELTFRLGDEMFQARAGAFVLAPGGTPHSAVNSGTTMAKYLVFFSPAGLERYLWDFGALVEAAKPGQPSQEELDSLAARYGIVTV